MRAASNWNQVFLTKLFKPVSYCGIPGAYSLIGWEGPSQVDFGVGLRKPYSLCIIYNIMNDYATMCTYVYICTYIYRFNDIADFRLALVFIKFLQSRTHL